MRALLAWVALLLQSHLLHVDWRQGDSTDRSRGCEEPIKQVSPRGTGGTRGNDGISLWTWCRLA